MGYTCNARLQKLVKLKAHTSQEHSQNERRLCQKQVIIAPLEQGLNPRVPSWPGLLLQLGRENPY